MQRAVEKVPGESFDVLAETVKKTAFKITRVGQLVGQMASERLGVEFGIVDLSLAPTPGPETPTLITTSASPTPWKAPAINGLSSTALAKTTNLPGPIGSASEASLMIRPM